MRSYWLSGIISCGLLLGTGQAQGDVDIEKSIDIYTNCLRSKVSLGNGTCWSMRDWIEQNSTLAELRNIIPGIVERSGVSLHYYHGKDIGWTGNVNKSEKSDQAQCEKVGGLLGYYAPKRRVIIVCVNNLGSVIDGQRYSAVAGEADAVEHHEIIHAAQHCYGGTLSSNPYIKAAFFRNPPRTYDVVEVVELYPEGQWVNELEARAGATTNASEIDYATLLYLACKVFRAP